MFKPGQSGNLKGKPPGSNKTQKLRAAIEKEAPEILSALITSAKAGDPQAAKLLLDRVLPSLRPETRQSAPMPTDPGAILEAVESGAIGIDQATALMGLAAQRLKIAADQELLERVEKLEELLKAR